MSSPFHVPFEPVELIQQLQEAEAFPTQLGGKKERASPRIEKRSAGRCRGLLSRAIFSACCHCFLPFAKLWVLQKLKIPDQKAGSILDNLSKLVSALQGFAHSYVAVESRHGERHVCSIEFSVFCFLLSASCFSYKIKIWPYESERILILERGHAGRGTSFHLHPRVHYL